MISTTPHAKVIIYNYIDRTGGNGGFMGSSISNEVEVIELDQSLVSISTTKHKSNPSGQFEVVLAPDYNWLTAISPGSWLSIHLSPNPIESGEEYYEYNLKMIGRVDSVRTAIGVDQNTGARITRFVVVGRDWGQVFESLMYFDQAASTGSDDHIAQITKAIVDFKLPNLFEGDGLASTTEIVNWIIALWGRKSPSAAITAAGMRSDRFSPTSHFVLPSQLAKNILQSDYVGKLSSVVNIKTGSSNLADMIGTVPGKLVSYDTYKDNNESYGAVYPEMFIGTHNIWQMLNSHCGDVVNELIAELRWDGNSTPNFALYKRVRPFAISSSLSISGLSNLTNTGPNTDKVKSSFFDVRRVNIDKDRIVAIDAGTNWLDRINFIEVMPNVSWVSHQGDETAPTVAIMSKKNAAILDVESFKREGLKPMIRDTSFLPITGSNKGLDFYGLTQWLPVLREWYFNTHKMLNGSISIMGMDSYIGVGDNIFMDASTLGSYPYVWKQGTTTVNGAGFLAHVESIAHRFEVGQDGARSFITTINFVRGIFTNDRGTKLLDPDSFGIDSDSSKIDKANEDIPNSY